MYLGATYPGAYGGSAVEPCVGQGIALLPLTAIGVGKSVRRGTGTSPLVLATSGTGKTTKRGTGVVTLTLATTGAGKSPKRGTGLAVLPLAAVGVGEAIEMPVAEGFAPLFLEVEGFGAGEGEYYGEARPDETLDEGDWIPVAAASLEAAQAHLRQQHERPLPRGRTGRLHPSRFRGDAGGPSARLSGADKAKRPSCRTSCVTTLGAQRLAGRLS